MNVGVVFIDGEYTNTEFIVDVSCSRAGDDMQHLV